MGFNSKRFWITQTLESILVIAWLFTGDITFDVWWTNTMIIEGAWIVADTTGKFASKKGGVQ